MHVCSDHDFDLFEVLFIGADLCDLPIFEVMRGDIFIQHIIISPPVLENRSISLENSFLYHSPYLLCKGRDRIYPLRHIELVQVVVYLIRIILVPIEHCIRRFHWLVETSVHIYF